MATVKLQGTSYVQNDWRGLVPRMVDADFLNNGTIIITSDNYDTVITRNAEQTNEHDQVNTFCYIHIISEDPLDKPTMEQIQTVGRMFFKDEQPIKDGKPGNTMMRWAFQDFKTTEEAEKMFLEPGQKMYYAKPDWKRDIIRKASYSPDYKYLLEGETAMKWLTSAVVAV